VNLFAVRNRFLINIDCVLSFATEHSEYFVLYCICGCLIGIATILITIIVILYSENRWKTKNDRSSLIYNDSPSYLPVYHYDGRAHPSLYHV